MSDIAIRAENLSKAYRIGLKEEIPDTMAAVLGSWLRRPLRNFQRLRRLNTFHSNGDGDDIIWALRDVSFEVQQGEVLGIIGRNGAGKSTLLKILSRITEPTGGRAAIRGRVSSLLEVGTGFHPELTGRENIYLNGTILGMTKREIDRKFDEIVDFSGVEKFLDTPIKRYSSGMKVRLAFAVAAHLDPEILLVDEVLAVGDLEFQRKCLGKMEGVAKSGRTVLFVSHNLASVKSLCPRCSCLKEGRLTMDGPAEDIVSRYLSELQSTRLKLDLSTVIADRGTGVLRNPPPSYGHVQASCGEPLTLNFIIEHDEPLQDVSVGIGVVNSDDMRVVSMNSLVQNVPCQRGLSKTWKVRCDLGYLPLNAGRYHTAVSIFSRARVVARFPHAQSIRVLECDVFGTGRQLPSPIHWGSLFWAPTWHICPLLEK